MKNLIIAIITLSLITHVKNTEAQCITGDCINGNGTKQFLSGSKYIGQFKDGKEHGRGTYYFFNGSSYDGEFENGNFNGNGKINYSNGLELKGNFSKGNITGPGEISSPKTEKDSADIIETLPDNIDFMLKIGSINSIFRNFSIRENSVYGKPLNKINNVFKTTGINPLSIWDLKNMGIDVTKEAGIIISRLKINQDKIKNTPVMDIVLFIPVTDATKYINTLLDKIKESSKELTISQEENIIILQKKNKKEKVYIIKKYNYVYIGINTNGDARAFMDSILGRNKPLKNSNVYRSVAAGVDEKSDIFIYIDINRLIRNNSNVIKKFLSEKLQYEKNAAEKTIQILSDYMSAGFTLDLENKNFLLQSIYIVKEKSKAMELFTDINYNKSNILGVDKQPLFLFLLGLNIEKYYKYLMETWPKKFVQDINTTISNYNKEYKINIVNDIIKNMGGNLNFGIYDGGNINIFNYNTSIGITIKNAVLMDNVINKIIAKIPKTQISKEKIGGINAYIYTKDLMKLYFGIKNNVLIFSQGKPMFESSLNGNLATGFTAKLNDKELKSSFEEDFSLMFFKIDEIMKAINNFGITEKNITSDKITQINKFDYLLLSSKLFKNGFMGKIMLKTNFTEPFFIGLKEIIITDKEKKKETEPQK